MAFAFASARIVNKAFPRKRVLAPLCVNGRIRNAAKKRKARR
jgi:hypothetical protein